MLRVGAVTDEESFFCSHRGTLNPLHAYVQQLRAKDKRKKPFDGAQSTVGVAVILTVYKKPISCFEERETSHQVLVGHDCTPEVAKPPTCVTLQCLAYRTPEVSFKTGGRLRRRQLNYGGQVLPG